MIYEPSDDSFLLAEELKRYSKGKTVLDMGAGSGYLSLAAISAGAVDVLSADINKEAVHYMKSLGLKAIQSNLFSNLNQNQKFDIILFNPPYLPLDKREDKASRLATSGGEGGDEIILKFLKSAPEHLNKNGIILLIISSLTPRKRILDLLKILHLTCKSISSKSFFMEKIEVWLIASIKNRKN